MWEAEASAKEPHRQWKWEKVWQMDNEHLKLIKIDFVDILSTEKGENWGMAWMSLSKEEIASLGKP